FTDFAGHSKSTNISYVASSSINLSLPIRKTLIAYSTSNSVVSGPSAPSVETGLYPTATYTQNTNASSVTFPKSVSATSTLLIVHITSSLVSGATYAGVTMTAATSSGQGTIYYLVNPTSGTNNVVVSFSSAAQSLGSAISYTGTDTTNPIGAIQLN